MLRRLFIALLVSIVAVISTEDATAQSYNRENLRGNIRTINQGGLVPIDSTAIRLERARELAARDSITYRKGQPLTIRCSPNNCARFNSLDCCYRGKARLND